MIICNVQMLSAVRNVTLLSDFAYEQYFLFYHMYNRKIIFFCFYYNWISMNWLKSLIPIKSISIYFYLLMFFIFIQTIKQIWCESISFSKSFFLFPDFLIFNSFFLFFLFHSFFCYFFISFLLYMFFSEYSLGPADTPNVGLCQRSQ